MCMAPGPESSEVSNAVSDDSGSGGESAMYSSCTSTGAGVGSVAASVGVMMYSASTAAGSSSCASVACAGTSMGSY